jgi:hypothetical protein
MTALPSSTFTGRSSIGQHLADKANGNAIKSFFKKANLQDMPKAPRHGYD